MPAEEKTAVRLHRNEVASSSPGTDSTAAQSERVEKTPDILDDISGLSRWILTSYLDKGGTEAGDIHLTTTPAQDIPAAMNSSKSRARDAPLYILFRNF